MPEIPLRLERRPDLGIPARQRLEEECRVGADATTGLDDGVESLERNVHAPGPLQPGRPRAVQGTPSGASLQDASVGDGWATLQYLSGSRCSARRTRPRRRIGRRFDTDRSHEPRARLIEPSRSMNPADLEERRGRDSVHRLRLNQVPRTLQSPARRASHYKLQNRRRSSAPCMSVIRVRRHGCCKSHACRRASRSGCRSAG